MDALGEGPGLGEHAASSGVTRPISVATTTFRTVSIYDRSRRRRKSARKIETASNSFGRTKPLAAYATGRARVAGGYEKTRAPALNPISTESFGIPCDTSAIQTARNLREDRGIDSRNQEGFDS
jgi:hypothetical protein